MDGDKTVAIRWRGNDVLRIVERASGAALQKGARIITAAAVRNARKHKLKRPGGYGRTPGYVARNIKTGPTRAKGKPAGSILIGFPGFQAETGTRGRGRAKRSKALNFLHDAVRDRKGAVLEALKETV